MPVLPHDAIVDAVSHLVDVMREEGKYRVDRLFPDPAFPYKIWTFRNSEAFVLLRISPPPDEGYLRTKIDVVAGGARDARPEPQLFHHLVTRHADFDWGGPFARHWPNQTVTYGSKTLITSDMFAEQNLGAILGHINGMVDMLGPIARIIASELVPETGGTLFGDSHDDDAVLLGTIFA